MRLVAFAGTLALAVGFGALVVGHAVVLPMLEAEVTLLDPNLARALAEPIALRLAEIVALACVVLALCSPRWLHDRIATTVTILLIATATMRRAVVLPNLYAAWNRVDLVSGRPAARLAEAQALARDDLYILGAMGLGMLTVAWLVVRANDEDSRRVTDERSSAQGHRNRSPQVAGAEVTHQAA